MLSLDEQWGMGLDVVFVEHRSQLKAAAYKILGHPQRAEDVVQDAYLKVAEVAAQAGMRAEQVRQPLAYLFQVVRNLAIDRHRRFALENQFFVAEDDGLQVPSHGGTPESLVIHRQHLRLVIDALAGLPERTRRAFELYRLGGLTQREVAEEMGVSTALVNSMIRDAMTCCHDALSPD